MNPELPPNLDLDLPFDDGPGFPPPQLSMPAYLDFLEFNRQLLIENDLLADIIARRPRPSEEMFVLP